MECGATAYHYACDRQVLFDRQSRFQKAEKIYQVLQEYYHGELAEAEVLDVGCSAGLIACRLAEKVKFIYGIDIDQDIIAQVTELEKRVPNFKFIFAGGDRLPFETGQFDIIICNIMYNFLTPDAQLQMFAEIHRCLRPGGMCYFAAPNRLMIMDGKFKLPFLLWLPRNLAQKYVRLFSRHKVFNEYFKTYWSLRQLVSCWFTGRDITMEMIDHPQKYRLLATENKALILLVRILARLFYPFLPNYIFVLYK
ncbi:MAG: class I SAM-dependent methyltransferase [Deltaproteobacteria bacterium]|nr:class I SAM-dependent methyltransferase [Deltaproteobacteria bacterium]